MRMRTPDEWKAEARALRKSASLARIDGDARHARELERVACDADDAARGVGPALTVATLAAQICHVPDPDMARALENFGLLVIERGEKSRAARTQQATTPEIRT